MPGAYPLDGVLGLQTPDISFVPDTTQRFPLGFEITFQDPFYGLQKMVYAKAAAIQETGSICVVATDWLMGDVPNSAGLGKPVYIAKTAMAANTFGWYIVAGQAPWSAQASVAAGVAFGITAAGQMGAIAAGKQINGASVQVASTGTITKAAVTNVGAQTKRRLQVSNTDGLYIGIAASGTGIAASTVTAIDPSGNFVILSADMTAVGTITATFTHTGFCIVSANYPFAQGQIA